MTFWKSLLGCDSARVVKGLPGSKMFLIIGFKRNTRQDEGVWSDEHGTRKDWDYMQEHCIASGHTFTELVASAWDYKRLKGRIPWERISKSRRKKLANVWRKGINDLDSI